MRDRKKQFGWKCQRTSWKRRSKDELGREIVKKKKNPPSWDVSAPCRAKKPAKMQVLSNRILQLVDIRTLTLSLALSRSLLSHSWKRKNQTQWFCGPSYRILCGIDIYMSRLIDPILSVLPPWITHFPFLCTYLSSLPNTSTLPQILHNCLSSHFLSDLNLVQI